MGLREFAENKKFYKRKGKITETLDEILYDYGEENRFNMSDDDMEFIREWNLIESYNVYKYAYEMRHNNDR